LPIEHQIDVVPVDAMRQDAGWQCGRHSVRHVQVANKPLPRHFEPGNDFGCHDLEASVGEFLDFGELAPSLLTRRRCHSEGIQVDRLPVRSLKTVDFGLHVSHSLFQRSELSAGAGNPRNIVKNGLTQLIFKGGETIPGFA
jgi:hypothetical protein